MEPIDGSDRAEPGLLAHARFVRQLARALVRDEHAAEDVVQDTWCAALAAPPRSTAAVRSWLATLARNFARRRWRGETRRNARERAAARPEALPSAASTLEYEERLRAVIDAVLALPEPYRATILQRYYEDLPPRVIAARTGVPVETVHTRLRRGLRRLEAMLDAGHGGARGRRSALLLPAGGPALLAPLLTTTTLLMKTKTLSAAALLLILAVVSYGVLTGPGAGTGGGTGGAAPASGQPFAMGPAASSTPPGTAALDPAQAPAPRREVAAAGPAGPTSVSGRVLDLAGKPVAGATVFVGGDADPFARDEPAPTFRVNAWHGRTFASDGAGRWRAELAARQRVVVTLLPQPGHTLEPARDPGAGAVRHVEAPAENVDFVVRRNATARLEVGAVHGGSGAPIENFMVAVQGGEGIGWRTGRARGATVSFELAILDPAGVEVRVSLLDPKADPPPAQVLALAPDERRKLLLVLPTEGAVSGFVVDAAGRPVADALVFFGEETRGRGDEPFRVFREERVTAGVRTNGEGWFRLEGAGPLVTAWHGSHSPATVPSGEAARIVLGARGSISGRLLDERGSPLPGVAVLLDDRRQGRTATSDALGRFVFTDVEAGARALWRGRQLLLALRLAPAERAELDVVVPGGGTFELEVRSAAGGAPPAELRGVLIGLGRVFGVYEVRSEPAAAPGTGEPAPGGPEATIVRIPGAVLPGPYLLVTSTGLVAPLVAGGTRGVVEPGAVELVVTARRGTRVSAVPADADAFVRKVAARVPVRAGEDGVTRFHVRPGRWTLVGEAGVELRQVEVGPEGARVALE